MTTGWLGAIADGCCWSLYGGCGDFGGWGVGADSRRISDLYSNRNKYSKLRAIDDCGTSIKEILN